MAPGVWLVAVLLRVPLCPTLGRSVNVSASRWGALQASLPHVGALCERHSPVLGRYVIFSAPRLGVL